MSVGRTYARHTILITGASSGLGAEYARAFAARGASLVLVARREDRLESLATELSKSCQCSVEVIALDLTKDGAAAALQQNIRHRGLTITGLVNNAGFGKREPLHDQDADEAHRMVTLNVTALVDLTMAFLPDLRRAPQGLLINIASVAAYQPIPMMAVYGASKAFVLSFTEALWAESRGTRLKVLSVSPGPTDTEFFDVAGHSADGGLPRMGADAVVRATLAALDRGETPPSIAVGMTNKAAAVLPRLAPRRTVARVLGKLMTR
jgi:short-subunit dehydrogenase